MNAGNTTDDGAEYQASGGAVDDIPELEEGKWYFLGPREFFDLNLGTLKIDLTFRQAGQLIGTVPVRDNDSVQICDCGSGPFLIEMQKAPLGIPPVP